MYSGEMQNRLARTARTEALGPVLLACEKCEHRLAKEGRFRQIGQLRQALNSIADEAQEKGSGLRILPVACLDVCPRGAMAVAIGARRGRGPAETIIVRHAEELRELCTMMMAEGCNRTVVVGDVRGADEDLPSSNAHEGL